jgi:hypothetical protein
MSNSLRKFPEPKKQQKKKLQSQPRVSVVAAVVLGLATLIGVPAAIFAFWPRVTVSVSDPVDPKNPFSAAVTVTNTGLLPLDKVTPFFGLQQMDFGGTAVQADPANKAYTLFGSTRWGSGFDLGLDDKYSFGLNEIWGVQPNLTTATVAIVVRYQLPIVHVHREKIFPLVAERQSNGQMYWYAKAP